MSNRWLLGLLKWYLLPLGTRAKYVQTKILIHNLGFNSEGTNGGRGLLCQQGAIKLSTSLDACCRMVATNKPQERVPAFSAPVIKGAFNVNRKGRPRLWALMPQSAYVRGAVSFVRLTRPVPRVKKLYFMQLYLKLYWTLTIM